MYMSANPFQVEFSYARDGEMTDSALTMALSAYSRVLGGQDQKWQSFVMALVNLRLHIIGWNSHHFEFTVVPSVSQAKAFAHLKIPKCQCTVAQPE
jgi:hypothetical protein